MAMFDLLALPEEIIEKITEMFDGAEKKTARLACKQLNTIVEHQLFSNIVLKYSNYQPDLICEQLEALAFRRTTARFHARSLEIRGFSPDAHLEARSRSRSMERAGSSRSRSRGPLAETHQANRGILAYLSQAICSLTKVRDVWWHISPNDPEWAKISVIDSLASLPFLTALRLSLGGGSAESLKLESLSNLRKITVTGHCPDYCQDILVGLSTLISNSPDLDFLDVSYKMIRGSGNSEYPSLHDLFSRNSPDSPLTLSHLSLSGYCIRLDAATTPHLRFLQSLSLHNVVDGQNFRFQDATDEDALAELVAEMAQCCSSAEDVWDALKSEHIHLKEIITDSVNEALLEYLASYSGLRKLQLKCTARGSSSAASDRLAQRFYAEVLPKHAESLQSLDVSPEYEGKWCFGRHSTSSLRLCTKLEELKIHIHSRDINRSKQQDVVWTLLSIADDLPNLTHLKIDSADAEDNRDGRSGNPSIGHIYRVNKEICHSVTTYGPLDSSAMSKVVTTPARDYVARSDQNAGLGLWYRSSMSQGSHLEL